MIKVAEFIENELLKQTPTLTYEHESGREEDVEIMIHSAGVEITKRWGVDVTCTGSGSLRSGKELEVTWGFYMEGSTIYLEEENYEIEVKH